MKKVKIMLIATLLLTSFFGCSKEEEVTQNTPNTTENNTPEKPNEPDPIYPYASFSYTTDGLTVKVTSHSTNAYTLMWFWGDGYRSDETSNTTYSHTYSSAGTYTVKLFVTSSTGHIASTTKEITVTKPVPTQVTISGLALNKFPSAPSSGSWDVGGKPDIYFLIQDGNGSVTYYKSTTRDNVNNYDCPILWPCSYTIYNLSAKYIISFWDEDDIGSDEKMAGAYWTPSSQNNNYGSNFNWKNSSIDLDFTIYLTWYTPKGKALYTKSVDFRGGEWQTDDSEVKQALGL